MSLMTLLSSRRSDITCHSNITHWVIVSTICWLLACLNLSSIKSITKKVLMKVDYIIRGYKWLWGGHNKISLNFFHSCVSLCETWSSSSNTLLPVKYDPRIGIYFTSFSQPSVFPGTCTLEYFFCKLNTSYVSSYQLLYLLCWFGSYV